MIGLFLNCSLFYSLRQSLSLKTVLTDCLDYVANELQDFPPLNQPLHSGVTYPCHLTLFLTSAVNSGPQVFHRLSFPHVNQTLTFPHFFSFHN